MTPIRRFVLCVAAFVIAGFLAWALQDVVRHGVAHAVPRLGWAALWAVAFALPISWVVFSATQKRRRPAFTIVASSLVWAFLVAGSMVYFANYPLKPGYKFLVGKPYIGEFSPNVPGLLWDVYSFPGDSKAVVDTARQELKARGYDEHLDVKSGRVSFVLPANDLKKWSDMEIAIYSGRTAGSDSGALTTGGEADWVTVSLVYPDPLPYPLRLAADRAGHVLPTEPR